MLIQAPLCMAHQERRFSKAPWFLTIPWSSDSLSASQCFLPSLISPLTDRMWLAVEKSACPWLHQSARCLHVENCCISPFADVMGLCRLSPYFFTGNLVRDLTIGGEVLGFPNKRKGKNVSWRNFSVFLNTCPVYFVRHCKNILSDWTARSNAA